MVQAHAKENGEGFAGGATRGPSARGYTAFGETVLALMRSRGITRQEDLAALLSETSGEMYKQQRLSRYFNGDRPAYKRLPTHLCAALNLDAGERQRLAEAFAYGQEAGLSRTTSSAEGVSSEVA